MMNLETGSLPDCGIPATVLVIDGDTARMAETARTLAQARFSVVTGSPEAARELVLHHAPHLALVEVESGGGAAAELARELKRVLPSLFVVEVSSAGWRTHRQEAGGRGPAADSRLIRPFREHELLDRVEDFLRLRQARRSLARCEEKNHRLQETVSRQAMIHDIAERKNLQKALKESEELLRTLCHAAPIGIFRCDTQWNNIYCNPRWEEISGISAGEGAGNGWVSTIHPEDLSDLLRVRAEAELGRHGYTHEHRKLAQNGGVRWVRVLVNPIKGVDGAVTGYVGTMEDITEPRQARQELLKAQKLESIGLLAGGIAHDFNNILTAVLGNISLARFQIKDPDKVDQRLKDAESAAARARDLTQQLLTFARGGEPVKKVLRLPDILKETAAFVLHGSNVVCDFQLAEGLWPLEADEGQLVQVLHNLVINAVQAMPDGGTITIGAENLHSCPGEDRVEVRVSDTGTGIPEAHLERIFDPYFTTKQQGSGLGLASCYSIVKKHGGTIRAESVLGRGTTFRLELPASQQHLFSPPEASAGLCAGSCRVLVMDDEEIVRTLACDILEQLGYRSDGVGDGKEALELYRAAREAGTPYAAVILDLTVPGGVGGKDTLRALLAMDPEVKGIVCSGYSTDPVMADFREYGFRAVLSKPYRPQDLSRVLKAVLGEQRPELPVGAPLAAVAAK